MKKEKREYLQAEISVNLFFEADIITSSGVIGTDGNIDLNPEGNRDDGGWT